MFEGPTAAESRQMVKEILVEQVIELQGCKADTLFNIRSITRLPEGLVNALPDLIDELVSEGKLIKVVYTVPELHRRCRSFLLPAGTGTKIISK